MHFEYRRGSVFGTESRILGGASRALVLRVQGVEGGCCFFFFQAEDGIRDLTVTGVQTCALPILNFESARLEMALKQIFENVGAKISDVGAAVNRRPTGVDVDLAILCVARLKFFDLARVGVKEAQRHS